MHTVHTGIILCQSIVRRRAAAKTALIMRHQCHSQAAVAIQAKWRAYVISKEFHKTVTQVVLVQSIQRQREVQKLLDVRKRSANRILACWRMFVAVNAFTNALNAALKIQSLLRRRHCMEVFEQDIRRKLVAIYLEISALLFR